MSLESRIEEYVELIKLAATEEIKARINAITDAMVTCVAAAYTAGWNDRGWGVNTQDPRHGGGIRHAGPESDTSCLNCKHWLQSLSKHDSDGKCCLIEDSVVWTSPNEVCDSWESKDDQLEEDQRTLDLERKGVRNA